MQSFAHTNYNFLRQINIKWYVNCHKTLTIELKLQQENFPENITTEKEKWTKKFSGIKSGNSKHLT